MYAKSVIMISANAQLSHQEMPCSSASLMPTKHSTDEEDIPELVDNRPLQVLYPPVQSPSNEEADWEVAAICSAPVYYRVKSHIHGGVDIIHMIP